MRNRDEQIIKEMQGNLFHVRVREIMPHRSNKEYIRMEITFLDGPLSDGYYTINIRTNPNEKEY